MVKCSNPIQLDFRHPQLLKKEIIMINIYIDMDFKQKYQSAKMK